MHVVCPSCAAMLERNARLVAGLKHRIAELHDTLGHPDCWHHCTRQPCVDTWKLIETNRADRNAGAR